MYRSLRSLLKNAFADCDGIAGLNSKPAAAATAMRNFLCVDPHYLIATLDADSFRRGNPGVSARDGNRLQQVDSARTSLRHFVTAGTIYLAQNSEAPFSVAD